MQSKTALVTGACINTGVAIVRELAAHGWDVVFTGRDAERVANAEASYRADFPERQIQGCVLNALSDDRTVDEGAVARLFEMLDRDGICPHALILNAADQGLGMFLFDHCLSDFVRVLNTNVTWNYCLIEHAAERMKMRGEGCIVFINSNTAYRAIPDRIAYETSKGAQLGMMRGLALDLGKYGIRVNAVLPGMIRTDRWEQNPHFYNHVPSRHTPLGDVATGEDIAEAVYYFVAHARNTTGAELVVDGGNTIRLYPIIKRNEESN